MAELVVTGDGDSGVGDDDVDATEVVVKVVEDLVDEC